VLSPCHTSGPKYYCVDVNKQHCWFTTAGLLLQEGCCRIISWGLLLQRLLLAGICYQRAKPADSSQGFAMEWMSICGVITQVDNHPQVVKKDNHYVIWERWFIMNALTFAFNILPAPSWTTSACPARGMAICSWMGVKADSHYIMQE